MIISLSIVIQLKERLFEASSLFFLWEKSIGILLKINKYILLVIMVAPGGRSDSTKKNIFLKQKPQ